MQVVKVILEARHGIEKSFCFLVLKKCLVGSDSGIREVQGTEQRQEVPETLLSLSSECIVLRCLEMGFYWPIS